MNGFEIYIGRENGINRVATTFALILNDLDIIPDDLLDIFSFGTPILDYLYRAQNDPQYQSLCGDPTFGQKHIRVK